MTNKDVTSYEVLYEKAHESKRTHMEMREKTVVSFDFFLGVLRLIISILWMGPMGLS